MHTSILPEDIAKTAQLIRPYIRRTPLVRVDLADFGLAATPVHLKLESLQHSGSFKVRGAFANLLTRPTPPPVSFSSVVTIAGAPGLCYGSGGTDAGLRRRTTF